MCWLVAAFGHFVTTTDGRSTRFFANAVLVSLENIEHYCWRCFLLLRGVVRDDDDYYGCVLSLSLSSLFAVMSIRHRYHHITVLLYSWHSYATRSGAGVWFITMNYSVHAVMCAPTLLCWRLSVS